MTNFEKIRKMGVRQMGAFLADLRECFGCRLNCHKKTCEQAHIEWLKSEAENDDKGNSTKITRTID